MERNPQVEKHAHQEIITMLSILDKDTFKKYSGSIEWCIRFATFSKFQIGRNDSGMLQPEYADYFHKLSVRARPGATRRAVFADLACLKRAFK